MVTQRQAIFMPRAYLPSAIRNWLPDDSFYLLPFQTLTLARRITITLHIFISQIAPKENAAGNGGDKLSPQLMQRVAQLANTTRSTNLAANRSLQLNLAPFRGDKESVNLLRRGMKEGLILAGIRSSDGVQRAISEVMNRVSAERDGKEE